MPPSKPEKMISLDIPLLSMNPDPVQYKPYSIMANLSNFSVRVEIPARMVISDDKYGHVVLTVDGAPYLAHVLALAIARNYKPVLVK